MNCSFLRRKKRVFKIHWNDSLELQIKNELDPRIRFPASVFSHIISSACGVVVTHQLPNVFFVLFSFLLLLPPPPFVLEMDEEKEIVFLRKKKRNVWKKEPHTDSPPVDLTWRRTIRMGKKISGAQKRKKKKEKEELAAEMERLKLGPTPLWTGLVLHHKDIFVSHVLPKLNETDRWIFSRGNRESRAVLAYAGVDVSQLKWAVWQCTSISTLEWMWECVPWEKWNIASGTKRRLLWQYVKVISRC